MIEHVAGPVRAERLECDRVEPIGRQRCAGFNVYESVRPAKGDGERKHWVQEAGRERRIEEHDVEAPTFARQPRRDGERVAGADLDLVGARGASAAPRAVARRADRARRRRPAPRRARRLRSRAHRSPRTGRAPTGSRATPNACTSQLNSVSRTRSGVGRSPGASSDRQQAALPAAADDPYRSAGRWPSRRGRPAGSCASGAPRSAENRDVKIVGPGARSPATLSKRRPRRLVPARASAPFPCDHAEILEAARRRRRGIARRRRDAGRAAGRLSARDRAGRDRPAARAARARAAQAVVARPTEVGPVEDRLRHHDAVRRREGRRGAVRGARVGAADGRRRRRRDALPHRAAESARPQGGDRRRRRR